jgi:uncharacterized protein YjiS (DUF1127 family)
MEHAMFQFARQAFTGFVDEWRREADFRELSALSDHLLTDIGLRRDQLPALRLEAPQAPARTPEPAAAAAYRPELMHCG